MTKLEQGRRLLQQYKAGDARRFAQHMAPHVVRPAQILWNQLIGVIFLFFAVPALFKAFDFYRTLGTDPQSGGRLALTLPFGLVMGIFGVTSLLRARRLSRLRS